MSCQSTAQLLSELVLQQIHNKLNSEIGPDRVNAMTTTSTAGMTTSNFQLSIQRSQPQYCNKYVQPMPKAVLGSLHTTARPL